MKTIIIDSNDLSTDSLRAEDYVNKDQYVIPKEDYKTALQVQDACNLSGVVKSFSMILSRIWDEARANGKGTEWVNTHPISILFADKIRHLSTKSDDRDIMEAYDACRQKGA